MSKKHIIYTYILSLISLLFCWQSLAHGDVHQQIDRLTKQIEQGTDNANLYFLRGQSHHQHGDFNEAFDDFQCTLILQPDLHIAKLSVAQLFSDFELPNFAFIYINQFLDYLPNHTDGLRLKAKIYSQRNQANLANQVYQHLLGKNQKLRPEDYIDYAQSLLEEEGNTHLSVIEMLEKSMQQFGTIVTLQNYIIELALVNNDATLALSKIDALLPNLQRKERWLSKKGDILQAEKQLEAAEKVYQQALKDIQQLPQRHKNTNATKRLSKHIQTQLKAIKIGH